MAKGISNIWALTFSVRIHLKIFLSELIAYVLINWKQALCQATILSQHYNFF